MLSGPAFLFLKPRITRMSRMRLAAGASVPQASCLWWSAGVSPAESFDHRMAKYADRVESAYHRRIRLREKLPEPRRMGLTGLEPVTLRLSSACSNQLSYRPGKLCGQFIVRSEIRNAISENGGKGITLLLVHPIMCPACWTLPPRLPGFGGKGIRTPDFQLAKLALYQLSYAPTPRIVECRLQICDFKQ